MDAENKNDGTNSNGQSDSLSIDFYKEICNNIRVDDLQQGNCRLARSGAHRSFTRRGNDRQHCP
jgi:hypothetical protein